MRQLIISHPNAKNTGSQLVIGVVPADGIADGHVYFQLYQQNADGNFTLPPNRLPTSFSFNAFQTAKLLQVFRGEHESTDDSPNYKLVADSVDGSGVYFQTAVKFQHLIDPVSGYGLTITATPISPDGTNPIDADLKQTAKFLITPTEATLLCEALSHVLHVIAFGYPIVQLG